MLSFALKMLMGDRAKYIGILIGLSFASFIISQQGAILLGIMKRTYGFITDTSQPDIWVTDPSVQYIDDIKPMKDTDLYRVRSVSGVAWAEPLFKGLIKARLKNGTFQTCVFIGIDDATLIGGPPVMLKGTLSGLRSEDGVIVDHNGAASKLKGLKIGDLLELNDHRACVTGICSVSRTFQSQPVIYTTYSRATRFVPKERKLLSFILVKGDGSILPKQLCTQITKTTGLAAYTSREIAFLTVLYYIKNTGILINFAVAIFLGFIIGMAIAGQTFYNFTLDHLRYFGTLKAMGADNPLLTRMILLQAAFLGAIGWGIGIGGAALFGYSLKNTELSFSLSPVLYGASFVCLLAICLASALLSIQKVLHTDPAIVFKS